MIVNLPVAVENGVLLTCVIEAVGIVALSLGVSSPAVQKTFANQSHVSYYLRRSLQV